jgi:hypothetical protein
VNATRILPILLAAALLLVLGCTDDTDPPWQLDHDRIIAVRATPPHIAANERAVLDALVGSKGAPVAELAPDTVTVDSPARLAAAVSRDGDRWIVTAPGAEQLDAARGELGLAAGAPVPLHIRVGHGAGPRVAVKTVWLGGDAANPTMTGVHVNGRDPEDAEIVVDPLVDVPLSIGVDDASYDVTWLSSCGTMHDFDLPTAYLRVEADDPTTGQLALVVRDSAGGVNWRIWSIRTR